MGRLQPGLPQAYSTQYSSELAFAKGLATLQTIGADKAAISSVIAAAPQLKSIAPYAAQLTALSKVPPAVSAYLKAHGPAVQAAAATTAGQWKTWYWICFGGIIFFLASIPLLRGRWRTRDARRDEADHVAMVQAELAGDQVDLERPRGVG